MMCPRINDDISPVVPFVADIHLYSNVLVLHMAISSLERSHIIHFTSLDTVESVHME